ncbi:uncharacterized protein A1O5_09915 [Cladophialophora psammophila CBS 110553]|uniref:Zn(2)-C6 fungal-type domain-containing protein n=1 Tax=Cladophialophora psammophila CBS 110553 TaxID=1182543 RepID=W9WNZ0_9EURO|nr:uncharacterized protein A1O5_09915 [Cladophialophora psammophila CBS 110553]EXJ66720.1 hypothetical protein A1O5_09915 [Cladophialophora psammophila CBS 110553]
MEETSVRQSSKRRASKACLNCRARKVRCDVIDGLPCTNCRLDRVECKVAESLRRRKFRAGETSGRRRTTPDTLVEDNISPRYTNFDNLASLPRDPAATSVNVAVPNAPGQFSSPSISRYCRERRSEETANVTATSAGYHQDRTFLTESGSPLEHSPLQTNVDSRRSNPAIRPAYAGNGLHNGLSLSPPSQTSTDLRLGSAGGSEIAFPKYIRRASACLEVDDVERLQTKGAFIIPDTALRNELLRCYVQYVHPYLPVLELEDFLAAIEKDDATETVSLLLFQAVMFAATPYAALRTLAAHGYHDRRKARRSFYLRVKLLCDMDYELDRLTVIQSTLLMTYWNETPDDPKDVWYWLGVAISLSKRIGLNYELSPVPPRNLLERRLWKRLWWSCYTRDRLVSLAFRRPARIRQDEFNQPMLELSDLETKPLSSGVSEMLGAQCPTFKNEAVRVSLAKLCIGMAELCVCLTPILEMQYRKSSHSAVAQMTKMGGSMDEIISNASNLLQCDHSLKKWYQIHAENLHCFNGMPSDHSSENGGQVLEIHKAVLKGLYLTSISILHRPQILSGAINSSLDPEIRDLSRRKTREAANEITILYTNLYAHGLVCFLPNTGVTCLLHAAIIHVLDQIVGDKDLQQSARRKFGLCTQSLEQLGETYASGAFALSFLTTAANKASSRPEATEASIRLGESMLGVKHNNVKSLSHFGCQFNVPPPGSLQPGGRSTVISAANSEPSRAPSRMDIRETAQGPEDTAPTISNQAVWRQYQVGVDQGYNATADGTGDSHNNISPNTGAVRGNGRTGDQMRHDFDYFLDMEGSADFFDLSDELGVGFDTQWFDTLGPYNARDTGLSLG